MPPNLRNDQRKIIAYTLAVLAWHWHHRYQPFHRLYGDFTPSFDV
jgi:hypothetical protein